MSRECPRCTLLSPDEAVRCDCGYRFETRRVEQTYLATASANDPERPVKAAFTQTYLGSVMPTVALAACFGVVGYLTGHLTLAVGPMLVGAFYLYLALRSQLDSDPPSPQTQQAPEFVAPKSLSIIHSQSPDSDPVDLVVWLRPQWKEQKTLSSDHILGRLIRPCRDGGALTPDNFQQNDDFVRFLHQFLARELPARSGFCAAARQQKDGWIALIDQRVLDAPQRTPGSEPPLEDVIGAFEVKDGCLVPDSYRRNRAHRLLSAKGLFQLEYALEERLKKEIAIRHAFRGAGPTASDRVM
jgi:hypothetical protein